MRVRDAGMKYFVINSKHNVVDATPFMRGVVGYDFLRYKNEESIPQVEESLAQYGEPCLDLIDVPVTLTCAQPEAFVCLVREHQSGYLVSGRIGSGLGDCETPCDICIADKTEQGKGATFVFTLGFQHGQEESL